MNKLILSLALVSLLTGCGKFDQLEAHYTGYSKICIDQVTYIQFTSGAVVQVNQTGAPVVCNK